MRWASCCCTRWRCMALSCCCPCWGCLRWTAICAWPPCCLRPCPCWAFIHCLHSAMGMRGVHGGRTAWQHGRLVFQHQCPVVAAGPRGGLSADLCAFCAEAADEDRTISFRQEVAKLHWQSPARAARNSSDKLIVRVIKLGCWVNKRAPGRPLRRNPTAFTEDVDVLKHAGV